MEDLDAFMERMFDKDREKYVPGLETILAFALLDPGHLPDAGLMERLKTNKMSPQDKEILRGMGIDPE